MTTIPDPVDPVTEDDCPHCDGTGHVDDDWEVNGVLVGATFDCSRCDASGRAPVDARGVCACEDCLHLPYDERLGSGEPWCDSRYCARFAGIVSCVLEHPHQLHSTTPDSRSGIVWWDEHAYREPERVTPLKPAPQGTDEEA